MKGGKVYQRFILMNCCRWGLNDELRSESKYCFLIQVPQNLPFCSPRFHNIVGITVLSWERQSSFFKSASGDWKSLISVDLQLCTPPWYDDFAIDQNNSAWLTGFNSLYSGRSSNSGKSAQKVESSDLVLFLKFKTLSHLRLQEAPSRKISRQHGY